MITPQYVYAQIAARYGIDPTDEEAVDEFFERGIPLLSYGEQDDIEHELLERDDEDY